MSKARKQRGPTLLQEQESFSDALRKHNRTRLSRERDTAKVKYTRQEYRNEYLKSPEWVELRSKVMTPGIMCRKCKTEKATDPHHMRYRNIVDVQPSDLVPLCRKCHELIEEAKEIGILRKEHSFPELMEITRQKMDSRSKRKSSKTTITAVIIQSIERLNPNGKKLISGILKMSLPNDLLKLDGMKVTQSKIDHMRWVFVRFSMPQGVSRKPIKIEIGRKGSPFKSPRPTFRFVKM